jgi:hypothetical protein
VSREEIQRAAAVVHETAAEVQAIAK